MIQELAGPGSIGSLLVPGFVPRFEEAPSEIRWLGSRVGEHTAAVLREHCHVSDEELNRLAADGVIGLAVA